MKKAESKVQKEISDYLNSKGYKVVKVIRANYNGVSDLIVCANGRYVAIEVKAEGKIKNTSPLQDLFIEEVLAAGGEAFAADSLDIVKAKGL